MESWLYLLAVMPWASNVIILCLALLVCKWEYGLLYKVIIHFELGNIIWNARGRGLPILFIIIYHVLD